MSLFADLLSPLPPEEFFALYWPDYSYEGLSGGLWKRSWQRCLS